LSTQNQSVRQRLLETVEQQVLPRLKPDSQWQIAFISPPFDFPESVTTTFHEGKPLTTQEANPAFSSDLTHNWAKLQLHSARFPLLGFVVEGSIDWRIGITSAMVKKGGRAFESSNWVTVGMPQSTFFVIPPGVPYSEQGVNFWERSIAQGALVKVLWIQFHRYGMQCFISTCSLEGENRRDASLYFADSRTSFAIGTLMEELEQGKNTSRDIMNTLLSFCLQRLARTLQNEIDEVTEAATPVEFARNSAGEIVGQACAYLEAHFDFKVTLEEVAAHVYISPSQLERLFRAEKGTSVREYLTRVRIDNVCNMLEKTDLRINHIGKLSGYRNHSYFCQVFQRRMSCTPQEYRNASLYKTKTK
jgi:AraC-like DNA-binding protein